MLDILVLLLFFILFGFFLFGKTHNHFLLFVSVSIFIPYCVYFNKNPSISPHHLLLYFFFIKLFSQSPLELKSHYNKFPLKIPLILIIISLLSSVYFNEVGAVGFYNAFRFFMENYSYLFIGFVLAFYYKETDFLNKMYWPMIVFCLFGLFEFVQGDNFIFRIICKAFPIYDGYLSLDSIISLSRTYRTRIFISTVHPSTLGAVMCCMSLAYISQIKNIDKSNFKKGILLVLMLSVLFLSGSRTGLICFLFGSIILFFNRIAFTLKIIAFVSCVFIFVYQINTFIEKFEQEGQGSSISMRQEQLIFSYMYFLKSPIYGNGVRYTSKNIMERDSYNDRVVDSSIGGLESVVFYQVIDYGLMGFSSYIILFLFIIRYFFKNRKKKYATTGLAITSSFLLFAIFSGEIGGNNVVAYLLIGYCMGISSLPKEENDEVKEDVVSDILKLESK